MAITRYANAADTVNQVALETGLPASAAPFASGDPAFQQLCGLLTTAGRELAAIYPWTVLHRTYSITTKAGDTGVYNLPDDYAAMVDQSGWNQTTRFSVGGALSPQEWDYLKASPTTQALRILFREADGQLWVYPQPPPPDQTITFEYLSRGWVKPAGWKDGDPYADRVTDASDTILFGPHLIERALKLKFLAAKGFDTTKAQDEFNVALESRTSRDKPAPILSLSGRRASTVFVDPFFNTPQTGFGRS